MTYYSMKKDLTEEQEVVYSLWEQFAYTGGKNSKRLWSGGLRALEDAEWYLNQKDIITRNGTFRKAKFRR
jgi:hypothetical protein